ncbi:MAG: hypothetical protein LBQ10_09805 [Desulfovibrio sp.]|jgi:hypothetical protein|nr:hypothetical protein [Desulfovibrio sp.]
MNVFLLLTALRDLLKQEAGHLLLPSRSRGDDREFVKRAPHVFIGALPPDMSDNLEAVPFVLIQAMQGHQSAEDGMHLARICFRLAVQDEDPEGAENHLHNLLSLIMGCVMRAGRNGAGGGRYVMWPGEQGRLWFWQRPDEQLPPFAEAYAVTTWAMKGIE